MEISHAGLVEIELSEGFSSKPYWDSIGKVWTQGYGETDGITKDSKPFSQVEGERRLKRRFERDYAWALKPFVNLSGFTQNMYDALASFIWNCGTGAVAAGTLVGKRLRARDWRGAGNAMLAWCKAGGKVIKGLLDRRKRERALLLKPERARTYLLTKWERETIQVLESERRTARRHGGWDKVDPSHKQIATRAKSSLRARVKLLEKQDLGKHNRAQRVAVIKAAIG